MYKIFYSWLFYFMLVHFVFLVYLFWANLKNLYHKIKKIDKKIWLILLLVFLFGFYLRNSSYWLGPHTDGYVSQESAHLWIIYGEQVKACALGNHADCQLFEKVLAPPGFPFIISLVHLIFGIHSLNASILSAILSTLTILLVFLIAYFIFKKETIGLYAALIFSLIPLNIINSQTGLSRPTGLFFVGLTILFYLLALKNNKLTTWLLVVASLSYSIYVRQENYILLPLLFIFFIIFKWQIIKKFFKDIIKKKINFKIISKIIILFLIFLILQIPALYWLLNNNVYNNYPGGGIYGLHYKGFFIQGQAILKQMLNLSPFYYPIFHYNIIISIVFFFSLLLLIIIWRKEHYFIISLFLAYFLVYSLMFDGNIIGTGELTSDYLRRSLMFHLPYAIIAGYGIYILTLIKKKSLFLGISLILLIVFFTNLFFIPSSISLYDKVKGFYFPKHIFKDIRVIDGFSDTNSYFLALGKTPNNCLVITGRHMIVINDYFKNNQRKVSCLDLMNDPTNDKMFLNEFRNSPCLIYIDDYFCGSSYGAASYACSFLNKNLNKTFLFRENEIKIYKAELKDENR